MPSRKKGTKQQGNPGYTASTDVHVGALAQQVEPVCSSWSFASAFTISQAAANALDFQGGSISHDWRIFQSKHPEIVKISRQGTRIEMYGASVEEVLFARHELEMLLRFYKETNEATAIITAETFADYQHIGPEMVEVSGIIDHPELNFTYTKIHEPHDGRPAYKHDERASCFIHYSSPKGQWLLGSGGPPLWGGSGYLIGLPSQAPDPIEAFKDHARIKIQDVAGLELEGTSAPDVLFTCGMDHGNCRRYGHYGQCPCDKFDQYDPCRCNAIYRRQSQTRCGRPMYRSPAFHTYVTMKRDENCEFGGPPRLCSLYTYFCETCQFLRESKQSQSKHFVRKTKEVFVQSKGYSCSDQTPCQFCQHVASHSDGFAELSFDGARWSLRVLAKGSDPKFQICLAQSDATRACSPLSVEVRELHGAKPLCMWDYELLKGKQWPQKMYISKGLAKDLFCNGRHGDFHVVLNPDGTQQEYQGHPVYSLALPKSSTYDYDLECCYGWKYYATGVFFFFHCGKWLTSDLPPQYNYCSRPCKCVPEMLKTMQCGCRACKPPIINEVLNHGKIPWTQSEAQAADLKKHDENELVDKLSSSEALAAGLPADDWCAPTSDPADGNW